MKLFLLKRLLGFAKVTDGLVTIFTPFRTSLGLATAKRYAREKYRGR